MAASEHRAVEGSMAIIMEGAKARKDKPGNAKERAGHPLRQRQKAKKLAAPKGVPERSPSSVLTGPCDG